MGDSRIAPTMFDTSVERIHIMNKKLVNDQTDILFKGILSLETVEECYDFFEDLLTIAELKSITQRFMVAGLLKRDVVYSEIEKQTGASSATISRVQKCLKYGDGGYNTILDRIGF